mmetsp:Transcript_2947/g.3159  ORF Transcript_2947/g.3159 Transcript_2947/m.3159 type:complete len:235 (+) Transcript_2947:313-1017(+)|eukprot:gene12354-13506_t
MTKRVLMVLTNHGVVEGTDKPTGWYLPECTHPYTRFKQAGYHIEFASIKGGVCPITPSSLDNLAADPESKEFWENPETRALTENTQVLSTVNPSNYDIIFFVGGIGTMWDFPFDSKLAEIAATIYENGGVVSAVCHGPIALANVRLSNGEYLVKDKEVAAFCNEEEDFTGYLSLLPEHDNGLKRCEDILLARGARYTKTGPWGVHVASTDRLFTGQNPASAGPVAARIVESFTH